MDGRKTRSVQVEICGLDIHDPIKAVRTLRIEIDEEAFERLYGTVSHPITVKKPGQKIAVRCISQFGEETTKVVEV